MDEFTARHALQTGVALIRRRPLLVLLWAAVVLAETLVFAAAARELAAIARAEIFSGRPLGASNGRLLALSVVEAGVSLVVVSVLWTSAFRAILRPTDRRALGFGPEELCVFVVWLVIQAVLLVVSTALSFLLGGQLLGRGVLWVAYVGEAVSVLGLFWSAVASVWAFGQGQVAPFRCWTIARGRFWLLAGLVIGVAVLDRVAGAGVRELATALGHAFPVSRASPTEPFGVAGPRVQDVFQAPALVRDVLSAAIGALEIAFLAGVVACAYRAGAPKPEAVILSTVSSGPAS